MQTKCSPWQKVFGQISFWSLSSDNEKVCFKWTFTLGPLYSIHWSKLLRLDCSLPCIGNTVSPFFIRQTSKHPLRLDYALSLWTEAELSASSAGAPIAPTYASITKPTCLLHWSHLFRCLSLQLDSGCL